MFPAPPSSLTVPKIEIDFDTPHRERFLRDEYPQGRGGGSGGPNRYTILGRGSYGVVIKARYKARPVAVKILEKHKKHQCRYDSLRNESNVLNLKHENIVRVLKIISGAQYGLVIMERFDGHCLQTVLNQNVEISVYHRLMILCDIINGLCFCHRNHIVHLDVKPQNVVVCLVVPGYPDSSCSHVRNYLCKLCDFGSSLTLNTININEKSSNRGTIRYMAPEQLRGTAGVTETADIYSFGITMWQLSEGKDPYDSIVSNEAVAYNVVKKKLRPDSVTTVAILRSEPVAIPKTNLQPPPQAFRARKNSDNSLEIAQSYFRTSSQRSFHSSIRMCSNISGQLPPNVECAAAAMSDVLKQQGIDLVEPTSSFGTSSAKENLDPDELSIATLGAIFRQSVDVSSIELNHLRQDYRCLYRKCWQHEATMRPSSGDVRVTLHGMLERIACCK
uniref:non-specific serine/threonine protein kinase n=1 Tax=Culex pipiens TaxID=7175 RepID=A0A8D8EU95_CULPI